MNTHQPWSEESINSLVDGQLSGEEKTRLLASLNADPAAASEVCEMQRLKALVAHAYQHLPASQANQPPNHRHIYQTALAASVLLVAGLTAGWLAHGWWDPLDNAGYHLKPDQISSAWSGQEKVVLHVASAAPQKLQASLDRAEYLLKHYRQTGRQANVELLVSGGGLDLLRADVSPYAERIRNMKDNYDNVLFVVCHQSIERLRDKGIEVKLLPEARQAPDSALEEVVGRLRQGWTYISI